MAHLRPVIAGVALILAVSASACAAADNESSSDPPAAPEAATDTETKAAFLYVMSGFSSGRLDLADERARFTLVLEGAPTGLVFFSDRPQRQVGTVATEEFLDTFDFVDDPPNAAVAIDTADEADIAVFQLTEPEYDAATATLRFAAKHLGGDQLDVDLGSGQALLDLDALPTEFGPSSLFIDDSCSFWDPRC